VICRPRVTGGKNFGATNTWTTTDLYAEQGLPKTAALFAARVHPFVGRSRYAADNSSNSSPVVGNILFL
jgi:hypothetical protein